MYISRIKLRNWKNFKETEASLGMRVFLIGPNASGKSNLLDAFRFLHDLSTDGMRKSVDDARGGVSSIRCLSATRYSSVDMEVEVIGNEGHVWTYRLVLNQDNLRRPILREESVTKNGTVLLQRPDKSDKADPLLLTQTALEQISANQPFRELAEFFASISYQNILPQVLRDPREFSPQAVQDDPFGRDFLIRLWKTPGRTRDARLRKITQALQIAVPQLTDLRVDIDGSGTPHLIGGYVHWRPHAAKQNESQFSDGTLRLFGLLWTVFEGAGPLLLEEPEISLHPEIVKRLPLMFFRINQSRKVQRQIILSTHSEDLLSDKGIGAEEVLRLTPSAEGTVIQGADDADRQAMKAGLTAADVLLPKTAPEQIGQLMLEFP